MFLKIIHSIASIPAIYRLIQIFFGLRERKRAVLNCIPVLTNDSVVLDLGGGTGLYRDLWPKDSRYICLDNDLVKLNGFHGQGANDFRLLADARKIPLRNNCVDIIFCNSMSHHIPEDVLRDMISESARVIKSDGRILFLDAVYRPESGFNRFLWSLDRGEFPHTKEKLISMLSDRFNLLGTVTFKRFYDYLLIQGVVKTT